MCAFVNENILPLLFQMMEDFSGLALPPLFGEHILEAELEPGGVELGPGEVISSIMGNMWMKVMESHPATVIAFTKSTITQIQIQIHGPVLFSSL